MTQKERKEIIARIERSERDVADLEIRFANRGLLKKAKTAEDYFGMFHNDRHFREAMKIGAEYRRSLRPKPLKKKHSPKK